MHRLTPIRTEDVMAESTKLVFERAEYRPLPDYLLGRPAERLVRRAIVEYYRERGWNLSLCGMCVWLAAHTFDRFYSRRLGGPQAVSHSELARAAGACLVLAAETTIRGSIVKEVADDISSIVPGCTAKSIMDSRITVLNALGNSKYTTSPCGVARTLVFRFARQDAASALPLVEEVTYSLCTDYDFIGYPHNDIAIAVVYAVLHRSSSRRTAVEMWDSVAHQCDEACLKSVWRRARELLIFHPNQRMLTCAAVGFSL